MFGCPPVRDRGPGMAWGGDLRGEVGAMADMGVGDIWLDDDCGWIG